MTDLDNEVNVMLRQLEEAENELKRKQDDADQDMMMAGMVRAPVVQSTGRPPNASSMRTPGLYCIFWSRIGSAAYAEDKEFGSSARYWCCTVALSPNHSVRSKTFPPQLEFQNT